MRFTIGAVREAVRAQYQASCKGKSSGSSSGIDLNGLEAPSNQQPLEYSLSNRPPPLRSRNRVALDGQFPTRPTVHIGQFKLASWLARRTVQADMLRESAELEENSRRIALPDVAQTKSYDWSVPVPKHIRRTQFYNLASRGRSPVRGRAHTNNRWSDSMAGERRGSEPGRRWAPAPLLDLGAPLTRSGAVPRRVPNSGRDQARGKRRRAMPPALSRLLR